jgi:hypothetical protein
MSKAIMVALGVGIVAAMATGVPMCANAADLQTLAPVAQHARWCGPCGCLRVSYDHHREMLMTYGTGFDPRNFDTTEPYYYFGRVRAYPHFWVEGQGENEPARCL